MDGKKGKKKKKIKKTQRKTVVASSSEYDSEGEVKSEPEEGGWSSIKLLMLNRCKYNLKRPP